MADFKKDNLYYKDYDWTASEGDNAGITGFPDSVLLNRHEGYEVLYFLKRYMALRKWKEKHSLHKLEIYVRTKVPVEKRSHKKVKEWLDRNFVL